MNPLAKKNKLIEIPEDVKEVTSFGKEEECTPEEVDMTQEGKDAIWDAVENYYRTRVHPAIAFCLRRKGKIVFNRAIGHASGNGPEDGPDAEKVLCTPDTPICQFSASKAITAMLVHKLVELRLINLTDPVAHYIPEFGKKGKQGTTILHVLSHRGGFPMLSPDTDKDALYDFDWAVRLLCEAKPVYPGGYFISYHAITGGFILGEIIRRVTGQGLREFMETHVKNPMGFRYFNFGLPQEDRPKMARNYVTGYPPPFPFTLIVKRVLSGGWDEIVEIANEDAFYDSVIPSANIVATVNEMGQFFEMLLQGGKYEGKQIFDPLTVRRSAIPVGKMRFDRSMVLLPMRYSAGFMLGQDPFGMFGPNSGNAFGHWGFINSFSWADPSREISVSILNTGKPFIGTHLVAHFRLLSEIAAHCGQIPCEEREHGSIYSEPIHQV